MNNGDRIRVTLDKVGGNSSSTPLTDYLLPDGQSNWNWNLSTKPLEIGRYTLKAVIVDGAGNLVSALKSQNVVVDNDSSKNVDSDGNIVTDANADAARVLIKSLSNDTGISNTDFRTNDNTLVFKGALEQFTANGDLVMVVLKNSTGAVIQNANLNPTANGWIWDLSSQVLPSGQYTLQASIVDPAGNQISGTSVKTQTLWVDTSFTQNVDSTGLVKDLNAGLQPTIISMTDTGSSSTDRITSDKQPAFSGNFGSGKVWTDNGDSFKFQIFDDQGLWVSSTPLANLSNDKSSWSTGAWEAGASLVDGIYVAKALISDPAGNILGLSQQAFAVDHTAPNLTMHSTASTDAGTGTSTLSYIGLSFDEPVRFSIQPGTGAIINGQYTGVTALLDAPISGTFNPGELKISYTDAAGNTSSYSNTQTWVTNNLGIHLETSGKYVPAPSPS